VRVAARDRGDALRRDRGRDAVDVGTAVLAAGLGGVLARHRHGEAGIRELLRAGERGRVRRCLQRPLRVVGVAHVDHERGHPEQDDERDDHQNDRLTAFGCKASEAAENWRICEHEEPSWIGGRRQRRSKALDASGGLIGGAQLSLASPNG
jgi:hypothetical protein